MIDHLFYEATYTFMKLKFFIYVMFYCLPIVSHMLELFEESPFFEDLVHISSFIVQILLISIEVIQMSGEGMGDYLSDKWNWIDITQATAFFTF